MRSRTVVPKTTKVKIEDSHLVRVRDGRTFILRVDSIDATGAELVIDGEVMQILKEGEYGRRDPMSRLPQ